MLLLLLLLLMLNKGGGATESVTPLSSEDQATVGRRVAIGAVASLGLAAFALIPTKDLRVVKPTKPMFFYITQLLQAQVGFSVVPVQGLGAGFTWHDLWVQQFSFFG